MRFPWHNDRPARPSIRTTRGRRGRRFLLERLEERVTPTISVAVVAPTVLSVVPGGQTHVEVEFTSTNSIFLTTPTQAQLSAEINASEGSATISHFQVMESGVSLLGLNLSTTTFDVAFNLTDCEGDATTGDLQIPIPAGLLQDAGGQSPATTVDLKVGWPVLVSVSSPTAVATAGQSVTVTATVRSAVPGTPTPDGSIVLGDQNQTFAIAQLTNGQAVVKLPALAAGTHEFTASYQGSPGEFLTGSTDTIAAVAGEAGVSVPNAVAVDPDGNIFFADPNEGLVEAPNTAAGGMSVVPGTSDLEPQGIAVDSAGNVYFSSGSISSIDKLTPAGALIIVAGSGTSGLVNGTGTAAQFNDPAGLAFDSAGNLYVADVGNNEVRKISTTGVVTTVAGTLVSGLAGDGGPAASAELASPIAVAVDAAGNLYIADSGNDRVREVLAATGIIQTIAADVTGADTGDNGAQKKAKEAKASGLAGIAVDSTGDLFYSDFADNIVREIVAATGQIVTIAGTAGSGTPGSSDPLSFPLSGPTGLFVDSAGFLLIGDSGAGFVLEMAPPVFVTIPSSAAPTPSTIFDGNNIGTETPAQSATTTLSANWATFTDPDSSVQITSSEWKITDETTGDVVQNFTANGIQTDANGIRSAVATGLVLTPGHTYQVTVQEMDAHGTATATSAGITIAIPLTASTVFDGSNIGSETADQTSTTTLSANWLPFTDSNTGATIDPATGYQWAIGTTPGADDVLAFSSTGINAPVTPQTSFVASATGLNLTAGQVYYVTVKATDSLALRCRPSRPARSSTSPSTTVL